MIRHLDTEREIYYKWHDTPSYERDPHTAKDFCKKYKISPTAIIRWREERGEYNSKDYFLSKKKELDEGMVKAVGRGNAQMAKLIKQLTGELVEKQEVTHKGLSADDIDRIKRKAKDDIGDFVSRIREVPSQTDILSN